MQPVFLNFYQRVIVWNMIGAHPAQGLKEASVLLRVIDKVRITDQESIDTEFRAGEAGGNVQWLLPEKGYGDKIVELENEEAAALVAVIEGTRPIRVLDAGWLIKVVDELKLAPVAARNGSKDGLQ